MNQHCASNELLSGCWYSSMCDLHILSNRWLPLFICTETNPCFSRFVSFFLSAHLRCHDINLLERSALQNRLSYILLVVCNVDKRRSCKIKLKRFHFKLHTSTFLKSRSWKLNSSKFLSSSFNTGPILTKIISNMLSCMVQEERI
jgi:hypothetical protein